MFALNFCPFEPGNAYKICVYGSLQYMGLVEASVATRLALGSCHF